MTGDGGDDYVKVQGRARHVRDAAVLFSVGDSVPRAAWIPRSVLHGADDLTLTKQAPQINAGGRTGGMAMTLRIRRWKAEEVGFVTSHDQETQDLFPSEDET